jgi:mono/diheme cytochrome c family protein
MNLKRALFASVFLLFATSIVAVSQNGGRPLSPIDQHQNPPGYVPSGKQMYKDYCAACHGADGRGHGPVSPSLRMMTPDLTTLAKRRGGVFPRDYVAGVLRFGSGFAAHGSSDMPVWGPIFLYLDQYDEAAVRERIKNLCDFIESIQERTTIDKGLYH